MKKFLLCFLFILVSIPVLTASAQVDHTIKYTVLCYRESDDTYNLQVQAIITGGNSYQLEHRIGGGGYISDGYVSNGWTVIHKGIPSGINVGYHWVGEIGEYQIYLSGTNYPACPETQKPGEPVFQMWLLTRPESACILISEFHPSVERQKTLCFPGQDWEAENALCSGWVYDDGYWDCDMYGYSHLPFADLFKIFKRHAAMLEELSP
jgi:hypothetical protein